MDVNVLTGKQSCDDTFFIIDWDYPKFREFAKQKLEEEKKLKTSEKKFGITKVVAALETALKKAFKEIVKGEVVDNGE